jgi:hypothetical protein
MNQQAAHHVENAGDHDDDDEDDIRRNVCERLNWKNKRGEMVIACFMVLSQHLHLMAKENKFFSEDISIQATS